MNLKSAPNPLREALTSGRFCYVAELVATRLSPQFQLLSLASQLARIPGLVAAGITNYAGASGVGCARRRACQTTLNAEPPPF